jgi:UDP-N-acetylglucosamine 4,6-dehydratase/5-epimerase
MFTNKTLMIVGGTGSFGSTLLSKLVDLNIKEIRIFSRDEKKQEDLRLKYKNPKINFIVGDVRNPESINWAMEGVDYVFQAAALKQVHTCEFYPMEAIRTNIIGSENVLEAAINNGVKQIVVLSTDKAVYPINTMGMTKAIMEKLAISKSRDRRAKANGLKVNITRYGNVMCSRGSVIPLFIDQILNNQPLTITDPDMTRFMMTLNDSVNLVLHAFENGKSGDTFIQKSPATTVGNLANALKSIFNSNVAINIIGARHGEKGHETLCSQEEMAKACESESYYRIPADMRDINYNNAIVDDFSRNILPEEYNSFNTRQLETDELVKLLLSLDCVQSKLI